MESDDPILKVENISKTFGGIEAVDGATLSIQRGSITGLIGPNGSGKSTLFNIISGTESKFGGKVFFEGQMINGMPPHRIFELGLGRTFQIPRLFTGMTVLENAMLGGKKQQGEDPLAAPFPQRWESGEMELARKAKDQLTALEISQLYTKLSSEISGGQMKLLQLANALAGEPKMLLLDEPTAGVAPRLAQDIFESIKKLSEDKGTTFFIIEHRLEILFKHVEKVFVMHQGQIIAAGSPVEIVKDAKVIEAYLGA
ncbi:MAG TPA: ABC transporter ATP-binding protein [Nitrososphaerales archaeon]|nr:ABC transporter ATP-binding protein [Nitrososphaerales archaeon]